MTFTLTSASTALFSTWFFVEDLGLLFDAGDGISAALLQKSRKVEHVFISHADRDHLCGLFQLHQLNAREGKPHIYFPSDSASFPALRDFVTRFDPQSGPATWSGLRPGETVALRGNYSILAHTSSHVTAENQTKALAFTLRQSKRSLKPEHQHLPGREIAELRKNRGEDFVTFEKVENLLGYSGDSPEVDVALWQDHRILVHEATFLEADTAKRAHSNLREVIARTAQLHLEALILFHFSSRYCQAEIESAIVRHAQNLTPAFPIYAVLPGKCSVDILRQAPVWAPGKF